MSKEFIEKIMYEHDVISKITWTQDSVCTMERKGLEPLGVGFAWRKRVTLVEVSPLVAAGADFIASVPAGAFWDGDAITECEENRLGWGGIGTLNRAIYSNDPRSETEKTTKFARRFLRQHRCVHSAEHLNSLVIEIQFNNGKRKKVALLDDYDTTADVVRTAWDELGPFDIVLKNNPNGRITDDAHVVGAQLGIKIVDKDTAYRYLNEIGQ